MFCETGLKMSTHARKTEVSGDFIRPVRPVQILAAANFSSFLTSLFTSLFQITTVQCNAMLARYMPGRMAVCLLSMFLSITSPSSVKTAKLIIIQRRDWCLLTERTSYNSNEVTPTTHTHTHTTVILSFNFVRDNRVRRYQKKHNPLTPIVVINHPLSASSNYYDPWHPLCSNYVPDSFFHNLSPSFLWSTSWPGTFHFILHTFLHTISRLFDLLSLW